MVETAEKTYTVEEYLRLERRSGRKYEYYNGKIQLMPGGTIPHNRVVRNLLIKLGSVLEDRSEFEIFGSDQKIYLPKFNFYLYPDALVVAGEPLVAQEEADAITNPILIIEVMSKSSQRYDRGQKFVEYQSLPSFKEYVLFRQDIPEAYLNFREEPNVWRTSEVAGLNMSIVFRSIEVNLSMSDIYHKVKFDS